VTTDALDPSQDVTAFAKVRYTIRGGKIIYSEVKSKRVRNRFSKLTSLGACRQLRDYAECSVLFHASNAAVFMHSIHLDK
jgi:hypothetical protein